MKEKNHASFTSVERAKLYHTMGPNFLWSRIWISQPLHFHEIFFNLSVNCKMKLCRINVLKWFGFLNATLKRIWLLCVYHFTTTRDSITTTKQLRPRVVIFERKKTWLESWQPWGIVFLYTNFHVSIKTKPLLLLLE